VGRRGGPDPGMSCAFAAVKGGKIRTFRLSLPPMTSVVISGTGLYQPPHIITNAELVASFNAYVEKFNAEHAAQIEAGTVVALAPSSVEFIEKASGIKQRYVMDKEGVLDVNRMYPRLQERADDQLSLMAEIAVEAAKKAMAQAGKQGSDIDAVICSSANMQRAYPAMAIEVQQAIGAGGYGFDMNVACSAATFALEQAVNAVRSGSANCVLVVNPEITSAHHEWKDRDCHFIFGDVCTAIIVERADTATSPDQWEVLGSQLATQFSNNIRNNFGFMNRSEDSDPLARDKTFRQEGRKVFKEVVPIAAAHIEGQLAGLKLEPTQVRRYWLHQANQSMNQLVIKKLISAEVTQDIAPLILDEYANTASAGSIIAFHLHRADLRSGDVGVICSFGAGYSVGSLVLKKR
jgi:beta-ketodecanoyl-[acyl-carrier-protein] synthase